MCWQNALYTYKFSRYVNFDIPQNFVYTLAVDYQEIASEIRGIIITTTITACT